MKAHREDLHSATGPMFHFFVGVCAIPGPAGLAISVFA